MFLLIPLLFIVASFVGITVIVWRKVPYLRKLTPETGVSSLGLFYEFFPELTEWFKDFNLHEYRNLSLKELEKVLRRLRLVSLKIDHMSDRMIKKIRKVNITSDLARPVELPKIAENEASKGSEELVLQTDTKSESAEVITPVVAEEPIWKKQEQQLIISIAQNPKEPQLYETLGDLYLSVENSHDAQESYEAALALNPHNTELARKYSRLLNTATGMVK